MTGSSGNAVPEGEPAYSEDGFLAGKITLRQPLRGHRAGTDAVLLAAAAGALPGGAILDLGAGVGTAGIAAAWRSPAASLTLVDNDPVAASCARDNLRLNGMAERGRVVEMDLFALVDRGSSGQDLGTFDLVLTNPPYFTPGRVRRSPHGARAAAHVMPGGSGLEQWLRVGLSLLAPRARLVVVHRAEALGELLALLQLRLGALRILPVYPRADAPAARVLVAGIANNRAPMRLQPGLVLHEADGRFSERAMALHSGEAFLDIF